MSKQVKFNVPALREEAVDSVSRLFDELFQTSFPDMFAPFAGTAFSRAAYPKVNIREEDESYVIEAEVPGLNKEQVRVQVENDILTISGDQSDRKKSESGNYIVRELRRSSFHRSFTLGENMDADRVAAKFTDGLLEIKVPKKVPTTSKVRQIELQ